MHNGFVPFVPPKARGLASAVACAPPVAFEENLEDVDSVADAIPRTADEQPPAVPFAAVKSPSTPAHIESAALTDGSEEADAPRCEHEALIRREAIRLAAIACGRALAHVAVIHPKLIAAFVDEARAVAGRPADACVGTFADGEFGAVEIEFAEGAIGADLATRAALLVRAAASG